MAKSRHILLKTLYKKRFLIFQKLSLAFLISASARHKGRKFTTIAKNQWFLRWPLPLMEWYLLNHWDQWFFDGFSVSQPLVTMFFNGCQPLVQRCDGNDTSFRSNWVFHLYILTPPRQPRPPCIFRAQPLWIWSDHTLLDWGKILGQEMGWRIGACLHVGPLQHASECEPA